MFNALATHGIDTRKIDTGLRGLLIDSLFSNAKILHLHWIHGAVTGEKPWGILLRLGVFQIAVLTALLRRKRIVWTVHNLTSHERRHEWIDRWNARLVAWEAHMILVHGKSAIPIVANQLGIKGEKIRSVYHGNYAGVIRPQAPSPRSRKEVRFLFFGQIRPYKGIENLLSAFREVAGMHKLHIAGQCKFQELRKAIEDNSTDDFHRVTTELQFIHDNRLQQLLYWCDMVVLPYRDIFTSGSLLMAMTAGRPVVAPKIGLIPEYIDSRAAFLYDPTDPRGLERALTQATESDNLEAMAKQAAQRAEDFSWMSIAAKIAIAYEDCL